MTNGILIIFPYIEKSVYAGEVIKPVIPTDTKIVINLDKHNISFFGAEFQPIDEDHL